MVTLNVYSISVFVCRCFSDNVDLSDQTDKCLWLTAFHRNCVCGAGFWFWFRLNLGFGLPWSWSWLGFNLSKSWCCLGLGAGRSRSWFGLSLGGLDYNTTSYTLIRAMIKNMHNEYSIVAEALDALIIGVTIYKNGIKTKLLEEKIAQSFVLGWRVLQVQCKAVLRLWYVHNSKRVFSYKDNTLKGRDVLTRKQPK